MRTAVNEGAKTGIFWGVALVTLAVATLVAWPRSTEAKVNIAGQDLFEEFKDPLAAASMKITTFDEEQGTLDYFEVRQDPESGLWKIMSRYAGYPADAVEQMKNAANSLVGLRILDIQTSNSEDHDDLGVIEPDLDDLKIGDDGVGRLVAFKDNAQKTLASLIIGSQVKDEAGKVYVRKPGQDPVYVVKFDESTLTTRFQDWIEEDLLQLSSIEIKELEIMDYNASLNMQTRGLDVVRYYTAKLAMDGADWNLGELLEYDPKDKNAEPKLAEIDADQKLNKTKLDALKNAIDDLKIVSVVRKPEGMSANLRASEDLLSDRDAVGSLAQHGFFPVATGKTATSERNDAYDIYSANGELSVTVEDGVKYIMRFGNISGVTDSSQSAGEEDSAEVDAGVNRYLLVTTVVDQSKFPAPELKAVPQTLEDLDAILNPKQDEPVEETDKTATEEPADEKATDESPASEKSDAKPEEKAQTNPPEQTNGDEPEPAAAAPAEETEAPAEEADTESTEPAADSEATGETESSGSGEATGTGESQEPAIEQAADDDAEPAKDPDDEPVSADNDPAAGETPDEEPAEAKSDDDELTMEERLERLEAEQEKITKENQRKMDERKDRLEAANRRVRDLNDRFADWYYVIPEDTYVKLHIKRDELFDQPNAAPVSPLPPVGGPQLSIPGVPGN